MSIDGTKVVFGTNIDYTLNTNYDATGVADLKPAVKGEMHGRPVGIVSIKMGPLQSQKVTAHFSGATTPSATIGISHTPKVRQSPLTVTKSPCG